MDLYIGGDSLLAISAREEMPAYSTLMRWLKDNESFRKALDAAREVRAVHFEERALEAAEAARDKDDVPAARLKFDAAVWAAGVHHPERYGKKTTIAGDAKRPVVFRIATGVPDPAPAALEPAKQVVQEAAQAEAIEAESRPVVEESEAVTQ
jgi:hypothetical protein